MAAPIEFRRRADRPPREVTDGDGRVWKVFEGETVSGNQPAVERSLIAEDDEWRLRRFSEFPDDWEQMSDEELVRFITGPHR